MTMIKAVLVVFLGLLPLLVTATATTGYIP